MNKIFTRQITDDSDDNGDKPNPKLYIVVFLLIICLLLVVSSAVVARTWYIRRRAMVLGLDYPPQTGLFPFFNGHMNSNNEGSEMENLGQLGKKPELFEVYLDRDTTVQFDKQRPFAATLSVPQEMISSLNPSDQPESDNDSYLPNPSWYNPSAQLARFSRTRSRFWPPVYRGRDAQYDRRQRLQALAELARERQEEERQRRYAERNPTKSLPPPIKENVTTPSISLSMLVELPTKNKSVDELPDLVIGLSETKLKQSATKDVEELVRISL